MHRESAAQWIEWAMLVSAEGQVVIELSVTCFDFVRRRQANTQDAHSKAAVFQGNKMGRCYFETRIRISPQTTCVWMNEFIFFRSFSFWAKMKMWTGIWKMSWEKSLDRPQTSTCMLCTVCKVSRLQRALMDPRSLSRLPQIRPRNFRKLELVQHRGQFMGR